MAYTAHLDTFARDHLPSEDLWPAFLFDRPELRYPERLNCASAFLDRWVAEGRGDEPCLIGPTETLTYRELYERVNRICNALVDKLGLVPGGRVPLRSANTPMMVATHLAVLKAGGIVIATMPMLRARRSPTRSRRRRSCSRSAITASRRRWSAHGRFRRICGGSSTGAPAVPISSKPTWRRLARRSMPSIRPPTTSASSDSPPAPPGSRRARCHRDMLAICDLMPPTSSGPSRATASSARRRSPSRSGSEGSCCFPCGSARPRSSWSGPVRTTSCRPSPGTGRVLHGAHRLSRHAGEAEGP